jgi:hypothetical protein
MRMRRKIHKNPFSNGFTHHKPEASQHPKRQKCFTTLRIINFLNGISLTVNSTCDPVNIFGIHQSVKDKVGIEIEFWP